MKSKKNKADEVVHGVTEEEFKEYDRRHIKHTLNLSTEALTKLKDLVDTPPSPGRRLKVAARRYNYTVHSRFAPGDEVHEVYFDEDIDAWNVDSWSVKEVHACIDERGTTCSYISKPGFSDMQVPESKDLFDTSLDASNEAKKRNNKG